MARYLVRRLFTMTIALWLIITITFAMMHAIPGGPFASEKKLPDAVKKNLEERYRLNDPLWKQYLDYLTNLLRGDLGPSFKYEHQTVNDIIKTAFPVSAALGSLAILFSLMVGLPAGIVAALKQNRWQDYLCMVLTALCFSVPSFILSGLLMYVFAYHFGWLPPAMWGTWQQVILPTIALSAFPTAIIARLMRSSMLEVMQQDYLRTARAKGLPESMIVLRHALRNAILPVVTYMGPLIATILTGSFVVESIFAVPGLGRWFVQSVSSRDYTVILGVTVFYSAFLMLMNLLVDFAYTWIDPRIKITGSKEA
ncbi:peptide ABC transporter permease [Desulforamulus profundi]|uniref:Peptide ABC transporter permease n=1 Tax=Desulforamulus profundi TaxID=1383067 RepID=A0A2C6LHQ9_9FIRM|nr:ABC transporter permease [Desulforamulus profundi]PHJ37920.1 peptide ABC transporter permease [Desulforamulus profundi]